MYPHCTGLHLFIYYSTPYTVHGIMTACPLQVFAVLLLVIAGLWCRVHHWGIIELSSTEEWDLLKTNAYVCTYLHMWLGWASMCSHRFTHCIILYVCKWCHIPTLHCKIYRHLLYQSSLSSPVGFGQHCLDSASCSVTTLVWVCFMMCVWGRGCVFVYGSGWCRGREYIIVMTYFVVSLTYVLSGIMFLPIDTL